ncbi:hypothetical protein [Mucilaginibacter aquatilis]|uniref:Uncharacterized protein n=1 Tax=Mucilaginibacter aquatilis TaxID=1517760 RepID=A0A6I4I973_9SPHI|nr:hypothetical protein [Mucilaginibacter aquatilis]MVN90518.1 hypothetical protein [Mucilaginibacter aquatilis]
MKTLYDSFLQWIAGTTWGHFIAGASEGQEDATVVRNIFIQDLYLYAMCYLLFIAAGALFYYYFMLNKRGGSGFGFKLKYWIYTLLTAALLTFTLTTLTSVATVSRFHSLHTLKYCLGLGIINALYTAALFFGTSLIVKKFSVANRTPF